MLPGYAVDLGQPKACSPPLFPGGKKRFEEALRGLRGHALAGVGDREPHEPAAGRGRVRGKHLSGAQVADGDGEFHHTSARHGFSGVGEELLEQVFQLGWRGQNIRQGVRYVRLQAQPGRQSPPQRGQQGCRPQRQLAGLPWPAEYQQSLIDLRPPFHRGAYLVKVAPELVVFADRPQPERRVALYRPQQIVHVVSHSPGHPAQGVQPGGLGQAVGCCRPLSRRGPFCQRRIYDLGQPEQAGLGQAVVCALRHQLYGCVPDGAADYYDRYSGREQVPGAQQVGRAWPAAGKRQVAGTAAQHAGRRCGVAFGRAAEAGPQQLHGPAGNRAPAGRLREEKYFYHRVPLPTRPTHP